MSALESFYRKIVARVGVVADFANTVLLKGEIAFTGDTNTFYVGDGSTTPTKLITTKSIGTFDFSNADLVTLPGGIVFDKTKPDQVDGVNLQRLNTTNGVLVRRGNNTFSAVAVASNDESLVITGKNGENETIDLALNLNNPALLALINQSGFKLTIGTTPPNSPTSGDVFFDSEDDISYMRIGDNATGAWVDFSS